MTEKAKVHRDGKGATFVGAGGYSAYRLLRIAKGRLHPESKWAVVKERHQRYGSSQEYMMPLWKWEDLLAEARELQSLCDGGRP